MNRIGIVVFALLLESLTLFAEGDSAQFSISVDSDEERKPWSHLDFHNDPNNFQFAIVTDRTGGLRKGVFPRALKRLNLLEPEFVVTVGDLIAANRHTKEESVAHAMWDEMETFIGYLDMPFFYLAGNHDNGSPLLTKVWRERFGVEHYFFIYKDVLFLCLNAQDSEEFAANIEEEQQEWAIQVLKDHRDVRWTFVFLHQPMWMYEKGLSVSEGGRRLEPRETGWQPIEDALQERRHTVFAGHVHQYVKYETQDPKSNYYSLATTGGSSKLRGVDFGEFDHATWVTVTDDGPKIANLLIDGILPEDVNTEEAELFRGLVNMSGKASGLDPLTLDFELSFDNRFDFALSGHLNWELPAGGDWVAEGFSPHAEAVEGETLKKSLQLRYQGKPRLIKSLPALRVELEDEEGRPYVASIVPEVDLGAYYQAHNVEPAASKK